MLEKIGLPAKPSMRGSSWVVDASHCQGCSSQFTFINRKHHCRRCGGIFCGSCTQQRMVLRGQGDSAVRICDPCKKLEEAARFEMRHGNKNRAGKGGSKLISKNEDEVLNQILGTDGKKPSISGRGSNSSMVPTLESGTSTASISNFVEETVRQGGKGDSPKISIFDTKNDVLEETKSSNPEELLQQAQEEKKKYKILKGEGKPEEALRAFKRGKELEREAKALEVALRKSQRKALSLKSVTSTQNANDDPEESDKKRKVSSQMGKERKDDLTAELRELGWSDADIHVTDKNPVKISLEGELSSLIGEVHNGSGVGKGTGAINKTEVIALKKKALMFKKEGKLAEAKEELKRAKVLEQKLEEQEFLAGAEGSDDELSSLINSMDDDTHGSISLPYEQNSRFDFDHLVGVPDDLGPDGGFEVTDEDMNDPDIAATLNSLGWTDDLNNFDKTTEVPAPQSVSVNGKALLDKAESLKQDALRQKQCGNVEAAMALLRKANLLQKDAENVLSQGNNLVALSPTTPNILTHQTAEISDDGLVGAPKRGNAKLPTKSKIAIQKELLGHKKKERALRREGRTEEAEEESKKGRILESQLEEMENSFKVRPTGVTVGSKVSESVYETSSKGAMALGQEVEEEDVTEQDMHDPALLSQLEDIGWKDERETENSSSGPLKHVGNSSDHAGDSSLVRLPHSVAVVAPKRSKAEIQRELLGLKRKALTLRRQGDVEDAEEILRKAKVLEAQLADIEAPNRERPVQESQTMKPSQSRSGGTEEAEIGGLDPTPLSQLNKLGSNDEVDSAIKLSKHYEQSANHTEIPFLAPRSKSEIQRELLGLKRKALNLRRQGELGESEEVLRMASVLELQMNEMVVPDKDLQLDSTKDNDSDPVTSQPAELDPVVETRMMNLVDLLTDNDGQSSRSPIEEVENKSTTQNVASLRSSNIRPEASSSSSKEIGAKDAILYEKKGRTLSTNENSEANSVTVSSSQSNESNLQHEIQAHKRRALALKREGRSAEALEELRQAKLLERSGQQKDTTALPDAGVSDLSVSTSGPTPAVQEDRKMTPQAPKPMTSRDRFKLQQKSLGHKRQAMKLRREGRMEEAEAEFELAKALENQLEESSGNDSSNLKKSVEVPGNDDLGVEDLLDPQLLAALKAIGLQDVASNPVVSSSARPEDAKPSIHKIETRSQDKSQTSVGVDESLSQEKSQLEERIKTEKVKAVTLKRAGKQAEALDALRRAKLYEKKLKSLA